MSIWFYLVVTVILLIAIIKIIIMKKEIKNITQNLPIIIKSDTNRLITVGTNDKEIKNLAKTLNSSLKELRRLELEYNQGNQELKRSITDISHDLRTPLTAIKGYIDLIDYENLTQKQVEYLNIICSYYDLFKENNIEPIIDIAKEKIIKNLDENMLKRIFENVISNVIKYSKDEVKISLKSDGIIEISNRAEELDSITVEKIFDRYYTVQNAKKSSGVGLSIAKQLVELNDGNIKANFRDGVLTVIISF